MQLRVASRTTYDMSHPSAGLFSMSVVRHTLLLQCLVVTVSPVYPNPMFSVLTSSTNFTRSISTPTRRSSSTRTIYPPPANLPFARFFQELRDGGGEEEAEAGDQPPEGQDPALARAQGERAQVLNQNQISKPNRALRRVVGW